MIAGLVEWCPTCLCFQNNKWMPWMLWRQLICIRIYLPAKSATFGLMPCSSSFLIPSWSPFMAATCIAVSPRSLRSRERAGPCPVVLLLGGVVSTNWLLALLFGHCCLMISKKSHAMPNGAAMEMQSNANNGYEIDVYVRACVCVHICLTCLIASWCHLHEQSHLLAFRHRCICRKATNGAGTTSYSRPWCWWHFLTNILQNTKKNGSGGKEPYIADYWAGNFIIFEQISTNWILNTVTIATKQHCLGCDRFSFLFFFWFL